MTSSRFEDTTNPVPPDLQPLPPPFHLASRMKVDVAFNNVSGCPHEMIADDKFTSACPNLSLMNRATRQPTVTIMLARKEYLAVFNPERDIHGTRATCHSEG